MVLRKRYLEKLKAIRDEPVIKVITGVRRCGKSTLLAQFQEVLKSEGIAPERIVAVNFEDLAFEALLDYRKLYEYLKERLSDTDMTYVFLDEIQQVPQFEKAVDSLYIQPNVDLYLTGSNAIMRSNELATLLSGRYVEIDLLPLSFAEYDSWKGGDKRNNWNAYYRNGGFPYTLRIQDDVVWREYLQGIYHTVLLKDIAAREKIGDINLLESVVRFLFDNVGNIVSPNKIANSLSSYGRKTISVTIENYIKALMDAFVFYKAGRYNIRGKQHLKTLEKYYIVDVGLRRMLLGDSGADTGHMLENIVYLELIRRGYRVSIGKWDDQEIDFIAEAGSERIYYQVSASVLDPVTFAREIAPLKAVKDNYPKFILSLDEIPIDEAGIRQINIIDFLLDE